MTIFGFRRDWFAGENEWCRYGRKWIIRISFNWPIRITTQKIV